MTRNYLIAGLGNPGKTYKKTRHNIGFEAISAFAAKHALEFHKEKRGRFAEGEVKGVHVVLMMPLTFVNQSGEAIAPALHKWEVTLSHFLAIIDDVAIPLGQMRIRSNSTSGGHNGLKSIEEHLQTNCFARLRIGVGEALEGDLASYVLGRFSSEEEKLVPQILERATIALEIWLEKGLNHAMDFANRRSSEGEGEKHLSS